MENNRFQKFVNVLLFPENFETNLLEALESPFPHLIINPSFISNPWNENFFIIMHPQISPFSAE